MSAPSAPSAPPLSLYVHFPWCRRKCPYCDFNSHEIGEALPEQAYIDALLADLDDELRRLESFGGLRPLQSLFLGGGTPSLFSPAAIGRLLAGVRARLPVSETLEVTLEANPGTTERDRFPGYLDAGINRLSLGVQTFQADQLRRLGRIHDADEARRAVTEAQEAGLDNINIDLMHGLPEQTTEEALADLNAALSLGPTHVSWYQLTIEPNTVFYRHPPTLPPDDDLWAIQEAGQARLAEAGYTQYEVSAYARAGRASRHNLNYWQFGDYLAIGAGAHGKLSQPAEGRFLRYRKTRLPEHYLRRIGSYVAESEWLQPDDLPFEFLMNALRLIEGVPSHDFVERTGQTLARITPTLTRLRRQGLLVDDPERLACTPQGINYLNSVLENFLEEVPRPSDTPNRNPGAD